MRPRYILHLPEGTTSSTAAELHDRFAEWLKHPDWQSIAVSHGITVTALPPPRRPIPLWYYRAKMAPR